MRFYRFSATLASVAAGAIAAPLAAAEAAALGDYLPDDILVVGVRDGYASGDGSTGTKTKTPLIDVPQTVAVITEDQLDDQATTQLVDALRYVPGVTLDTGEGHRDQIFIRGQLTTADFYLDGLRDDAEYYRPLYNVARVEVLKGANAMIFGRGGGGGVINRVSKTANLTDPAFDIDGGIDSFGAFALAADLNQPIAVGIAARINAAYEEFDNARDFYEGRFVGFSPTLTAALGERTRLSAFYTYDDDRRTTDRGLPSLGGEPLRGYDRTFFGDPEFNRAESTAHIGRIRLDHAFSDGLSVNLTGQFADHEKFYANVVPASATATTATLNGYTSGTDRQNRIVQGNLVWRAGFGAIESTLLAGVEASRQDTIADRFNIAFADGSTSVTVPLARVLAVPSARQTTIQRASTSRLDTVSGYIQEQLDFGPVQLIAGVRYDEFDLATVNRVNGFAASRTDRKWSPRAGAVVKPGESISLFAGYSTSFLPQSGDQFSVLDPTTATLAPEKFENLEAGVKWALTPQLFATAAVFRLDRSNTRAVDPANPALTILTGKSRVEGFEASLVGRLMPNLQASLGYTYLDGELLTTSTAGPAGRRQAQLPKHQASAWARYEVTDRLGLGLGAVYQGEQFASVSNAVTLPDWVRFDAAAFFDLSERLALQVNVENLFDSNYYSSAHGDNNIQPGDPFSVRFGVKVKL
jgi:catecholate siderophore receptor